MVDLKAALSIFDITDSTADKAIKHLIQKHTNDHSMEDNLRYLPIYQSFSNDNSSTLTSPLSPIPASPSMATGTPTTVTAADAYLMRDQQMLLSFAQQYPELLYYSIVKFADSEIFLMLTREKLILMKGSTVANINLDEVYSIKFTSTPIHGYPNQNESCFTLCTLIDRHEVIDYEFLCRSPRECQYWIHLVNKAIWFSSTLPQSLVEVQRELETATPDQLILQLPPRRILCIVNPFGGDKTGYQSFMNRAKIILDRCPGIETRVVLTERAGHAQQLCEELSLYEWDEVACSGGDGILHECINGLMRHRNWQRAIKIPICNIPTGSTNALEVSVLGEQNVALAAFTIARGFTRPLDICSNFQKLPDPQTGKFYLKREYSFLCLMFGFLSNVTHKTDALRKLHITSLRNKLGAIKELLLKRSYRTRLSYVPYVCSEEDRLEFSINQKNNELDDQYDVTNEKYTLMRHRNQRTNIYANRMKVNAEMSWNETYNSLSGALNDGPDCPLLHKYFPEVFEEIEENKCECKDVLEDSPQPSEKVIPYEQVNPDIVTIEDDFFGILAVNTSHIATGFPLGMSSYPNSEFLDLMWILATDRNTSRRSFFKHFFKMETASDEGEVVLSDHSAVHYDKTQAFKLTPLETGSAVSIDGEEGAYTETYVEIHPGLVNYIVL